MLNSRIAGTQGKSLDLWPFLPFSLFAFEKALHYALAISCQVRIFLGSGNAVARDERHIEK